MSEFLEKFGKKIKNHRNSEKLSQEKLAEYVNVSTTTIASIEQGRTFLKADTLEKICNVLNIEICFLKKKKNPSIVDKITDEAKSMTLEKQKQALEILKILNKD